MTPREGESIDPERMQRNATRAWTILISLLFFFFSKSEVFCYHCANPRLVARQWTRRPCVFGMLGPVSGKLYLLNQQQWSLIFNLSIYFSTYFLSTLIHKIIGNVNNFEGLSATDFGRMQTEIGSVCAPLTTTCKLSSELAYIHNSASSQSSVRTPSKCLKLS